MTTRTVEDLLSIGRAARSAARQVAKLSSGVKNQTLHNLAGLLEGENEALLLANAEDCAEARANGLSEAMIDRLLLTPDRLRGTAEEQRKVRVPVGKDHDGDGRDGGGGLMPGAEDESQPGHAHGNGQQDAAGWHERLPEGEMQGIAGEKVQDGDQRDRPGVPGR